MKAYRHMKYLLACLFAVLLWVPVSSHAAIFFDTDFETCAVGTGDGLINGVGDFPCEGWDDGGKEFINAPLHNKIEITNALSLTGTKSVKATFVARFTTITGTSCALDNPTLAHFFAASDHIFIRFATRQSPGFQVGQSNLSKMVRFPTSGGYPTFSFLTGSDTYKFGIEGAHDVGTVITNAGVLPSQTLWDQVELEWKFNTPGQSDGLIRVWINGVLRIEMLNRQLRGPTTTSVGAGGQVAPSTTRFNVAHIFIQCGLGNMYFDRFAVGNTRIGLVTGTTPPPPDTITPLPPTNLTGNAATSTLTWVAGSDPAPSSGYAGVQVFRCVRTAGDCSADAQLTFVAAPATSYVDAGCSPGFTCDYKVRSVDGAGNVSIFTAEVSNTIPTTNRRVLFTDTFIRADNADIGSVYDAGYTTGNPFKIASNRLAPSVPSARNFETYNVAVPNDQFGSILLSDGVSVNDNAYVLLRHSAPATWNGYECGVLDTVTGRLQRLDAGVGTVLDLTTITPPLAIGDRIRGEAQGTTLRCYVVRTNAQGAQTEELYASASDATYASGRVGLRIAPAALPSIRVSEFLVGDFTGVVDSAITHDSTSTSGLANTSASLSWNHTVGTADNRLLTVCTQIRNSNTGLTTTSVTANGVNLVKFREDSRVSGTNNLYTSLWRQIAPAPGVNNIIATFSAAPTSHYGLGSSSSFSGVEQVTPVDAVGGSNGTGTAVSLPLTTTVTGTLAIDCVLGLDDFTVAGGSQTIRRNSITSLGADGVGSSTKPLASIGAATTAWTQATATDWTGSVIAIKPAQVNNLQRPKILSGTVTPTGATGLTYDVTTPTALRVIHGRNSGIPPPQSVDVPIANVPGGVLSRTWTAGDEFAQILALDQFGIVNGTDLEYIARSLIGVAPPANTNAVTMTDPQPSTELPAGTTSAIISMTIDQTQLERECRWSDTDEAYADMDTANQMAINGTFAAATKTGLSNGQSYTVYRTCIVSDGGGAVLAESPTRSSSTFSVANATGDVTPPGNVTNLVCQVSSTQADCQHSAATDAVSYEAYLSSDGGATYNLTKTYTGTSFMLANLNQSQTYSVKVLARDVVGNPSAADSNIQTFTTPVLTDVIPPGNVPSLAVQPFANSVLVFFGVGADAINTTVEYCDEADCTPGESVKTGSVSPMLIDGLAEGTVYRFTAYHTDQASNQSVTKHPIITITTKTNRLPQIRIRPQFGVDRVDAASRSTSGARQERAPD